jgi:hypothetical protein
MRKHSTLGLIQHLAAAALWGLLSCAAAPTGIAVEPAPASIAAYDSYVNAVESRLSQQHRSTKGFLVLPASGAQGELSLRRGDVIVEKLTPAANIELRGALLHHWRGTAFAAGARAADFERVMRDFEHYPQYFSPQVVQAKAVMQQSDHMQAVMRIRQKHGITVVMDASYDIVFGGLDARHGYSNSRSTNISEIEAAGTAQERVLDANEEHGFLWRLNTDWSYEERDGGVYLQIESVSLTRSIPRGLGWAVGPFVESVPRQSLEFTLRAACKALHQQ